MKISTKLFMFLIPLIIFAVITTATVSFLDITKLNSVAVENIDTITNSSISMSSVSLQAEAERNIVQKAADTAEWIQEYLNRSKEDLLIFSISPKEESSYLGFLQHHISLIHNPLSRAPSDTFPYESDPSDVLRVPRYKRVVFIDENGIERIKFEENIPVHDYDDVSNEYFFIETKKLKQGEIYKSKKNYTIWDCTTRTSTLIAEPIYTIKDDCPDKSILALDAAGYERFKKGYLRYSTPVYEHGIFKGIVSVDIDFLPIMKHVNDLTTGKTGYAFLEQSVIGTPENLAGEGITLAHPSHQFVALMDPASLYKLELPGLDKLRELSQKQHKGETGIGRYTFREVDKYTSYSGFEDLGVIWSVGIANPVEEFIAPVSKMQQHMNQQENATKDQFEDFTQQYLRNLFVINLLIIILFIILVFLLVRSMTNSISLLQKGVKRLSKGELDYRVIVSSKDEIGDLAADFNQMASKLEIYQSEALKSEIQKKAELEKEVKEKTKEINQKLKDEEQVRTATMNILEDIDEARKELEEEDIRKNELFNITSHELKTPLVPIKGYLNLLLGNKYGRMTEQQVSSLTVVNRNVERLAKLIDDVLDIARLQANKMKFFIESVDPRDIINDSVDTIMPFAEKEGINLVKSIEKLPPKVKTDRSRGIQVITNLINNAVKFTPKKGRITVRAYNDRKFWYVGIADTGIGISKENQEKVFERFYQVDSSITRKYGGTGLGLSICKGIVEGQGGSITVKSELNKGTTFTVKLPIIAFIDLGQAQVYGSGSMLKQAGRPVKEKDLTKETKQETKTKKAEEKKDNKTIVQDIDKFFQ